MSDICIFAIDPGTHESGYVLYDNKGGVIGSGVVSNEYLLHKIRENTTADVLAIEKIVNYGRAVGQETFDTCVWMGRMQQCWPVPEEVVFVPRLQVKKELGLKGNATDAMVNARLREVVGEKGTKAKPGPTYGVKSHAWSALGVAWAAMAA